MTRETFNQAYVLEKVLFDYFGHMQAKAYSKDNITPSTPFSVLYPGDETERQKSIRELMKISGERLGVPRKKLEELAERKYNVVCDLLSDILQFSEGPDYTEPEVSDSSENTRNI